MTLMRRLAYLSAFMLLLMTSGVDGGEDREEEQVWERLRNVFEKQRLEKWNWQHWLQEGLLLQSLGLDLRALDAYKKADHLFQQQSTTCRPEEEREFDILASNEVLLLNKAGRLEEAIEAGRRGLVWNSENGALLNNLAIVFSRLGQDDLAESLWRSAAKVLPESVEPRASLGNLLADRGHTDDARSLLLDASHLALQSGRRVLAFALQVRAALLLERVFGSPAQLAAAQERYITSLEDSLGMVRKTHLQQLRNSEHVDVLAQSITDLGYYFCYFGFPNKHVRELQTHLFRSLAPEIHQSFLHMKEPSHSVEDQTICYVERDEDAHVHCACLTAGNVGNRWTAPLQLASQKRIGFFGEFFADHSVSKLVRNTIRLLASQDDWHVTLFDVSFARKDNVSKRLERWVDKVVHIHGAHEEITATTLAAQKAIADEHLDVLIFTEIGMGALSMFVAHARMAPVQMMFWGHPVTSGLRDTVDYFISSRLFESNWEPAKQGAKYSEDLWLMEGLSTAFPKPPPPALTDKGEARRVLLAESFSPLANYYVCPQTPYKLHPLMDRAFLAILNRDPKSVLVLLESKHPGWTDIVRERLLQALPQNERAAIRSRIVILSPLKIEDFLSLLAHVADVVLDPFPFGGGVSHFEALSVGAPVVVFRHSIPWIPQYAPGIYQFLAQHASSQRQRNRIWALLPDSVEGYVRAAVRIATDSAFAALVRKDIKDIVDATGLFFDENASDNEMHQFPQSQQVLQEWKRMLSCAISRRS